ncbi:MAG: hypothetical protein QOD07_1706 [Frankiaceae bacterium]|jgi:hypothetical protein|nr:hypothetical protein [Frankiaceae bacterium]
MASSPELVRAARALLLPLQPMHEDTAVDAVRDGLLRRGIAESDQPTYLTNLLDEWRAVGSIPAGLSQVITWALVAGFPVHGAKLASRYVALWTDLQERHLLEAAEATALLSQAVLVASLAEGGVMSAAQIAQVLMSRHDGMFLPWPAVAAVLAAMGLKPALDEYAVQGLYAEDELQEVARFADADLSAMIELVRAEAARLGFPGDLGNLLRELVAPAQGVAFIPYWVILHFFCFGAAFYDHALTYAYEFSPRGQIAQWVRQQYPSALIASDSPVLNNLKSVYELDEAWATSKDLAQRPQALALVGVLRGLSAMAFTPRRELAALVRQALLRAVRLLTPPDVTLPGQPTDGQVRRVLEAVGGAGTATRGMIEQRVVDAVASLLHPSPYVSRGLGDSVNASNISRRKLGDCDFQDVGARHAVAYEAHGGTLTQVYVDQHVNTLRQVLPLRWAEEWELIDPDANNWRVEIVFVSQATGPGLIVPADVAGVPTSFRFETFSSFSTPVLASSGALVDAFARHVHARLNEASTPRFARETYAAIAGPP